MIPLPAFTRNHALVPARRGIILALILLACPLPSGADEGAFDHPNAYFMLGPDWRGTTSEQRPGIPNTVGGLMGLGLYAPLGETLFLAVTGEVALTSQLGGRTGGTIGDWSGTQVFPLIPALGFRLGNIHVSGGYPMYGWMTLLAEAANGEAVKYSEGNFWQTNLGWETELGLFGFQYRWGEYTRETVGSQIADLSPGLQVSDFSILFTLPFSK